MVCHKLGLNILGRYTQKATIPNHRIICIHKQADTGTFAYKDYADNKHKQIALARKEFIRRFRRHLLPERLSMIKKYGYPDNRGPQRIHEAVNNLHILLR